MEHREWKVAGAPVSGFVWQAERPRGKVLLSHGVGEYATRYVERYHALIPTLVQAGFTVYAYDQRGHGHSAGRRAVVDLNLLVEDHLRAREALRGRSGDASPGNRSPLPLFALGHSMGGLVTAASASRDPRGLSGVILSSPALLVGQDEPALVKALAPLLARVAPAAPVSDLGTGGLSRLADEVSAYEADEWMYHGKVRALTAATMLSLSARLWADYPQWTLPTLVFHGTADKITDPAGSVRFTDTIASPDKTLILQDGGYHELLNDEPREEIRAALVAWLLARS